MIIKTADDKTSAIATLEMLSQKAEGTKKKEIEKELKILLAGIKGEKESAYLIDFHFKDSQKWAVIHDLRIQVGDRVAQIDHLVINRFLECYVLETKHFSASVKISEQGEFLRWNPYYKTYEGMPSPLEQNHRHILALKEVEKFLRMPTRMGLRMPFTFKSYILVSPAARIDRPKKFDTSNVIKADTLRTTINKNIDDENALYATMSVAKMVSSDTLMELAQQLASLHSPVTIDYVGKFGLKGAPDSPLKSPIERSAKAEVKPKESASESNQSFVCRHCQKTSMTIQYGQYGYYFKCKECEGNTPIKISCGQEGHKERVRKDGNQFYRECNDCHTSTLFYTNPG